MMSNRKWLLTVGLVLMLPLLVALWAGSINAFLASDIAMSWQSGGRLPAGNRTSIDTYLITLVGTCIWAVGAWRVGRMWRRDGKEPRQRSDRDIRSRRD